jgi:AcrR family transcriptional regulator
MNTGDAKQYIIATAKTLFLQSGIKTVSMDVIAQEGHISKKTIYRYFKNKKHLLDEIVSEMEVVLLKQIDTRQAWADPVASIFFIYQAILVEASPFLNDRSLKHCYPAQYEHLVKMLLALFQQTIKTQTIKGINLKLYSLPMKIEEFYLLLANILLTTLTEPDFVEHSLNTSLSAKDIIYYSLRSVVTPDGLKVLEQTASSVEIRAVLSN